MSSKQQAANLTTTPSRSGDSRSGHRHKPILAERFKTKLCRTFSDTGSCPYEERCMFAHGEAKLRTKEMNLAAKLTTEDAIRNFQQISSVPRSSSAVFLTSPSCCDDERAKCNRSPDTQSASSGALADDGASATPIESARSEGSGEADFAREAADCAQFYSMDDCDDSDDDEQNEGRAGVGGDRHPYLPAVDAQTVGLPHAHADFDGVRAAVIEERTFRPPYYTYPSISVVPKRAPIATLPRRASALRAPVLTFTPFGSMEWPSWDHANRAVLASIPFAPCRCGECVLQGKDQARRSESVVMRPPADKAKSTGVPATTYRPHLI
jgi:hypothetical protein